jgi:hypothetical protein
MPDRGSGTVAAHASLRVIVLQQRPGDRAAASAAGCILARRRSAGLSRSRSRRRALAGAVRIADAERGPQYVRDAPRPAANGGGPIAVGVSSSTAFATRSCSCKNSRRVTSPVEDDAGHSHAMLRGAGEIATRARRSCGARRTTWRAGQHTTRCKSPAPVQARDAATRARRKLVRDALALGSADHGRCGRRARSTQLPTPAQRFSRAAVGTCTGVRVRRADYVHTLPARVRARSGEQCQTKQRDSGTAPRSRCRSASIRADTLTSALPARSTIPESRSFI